MNYHPVKHLSYLCLGLLLCLPAAASRPVNGLNRAVEAATQGDFAVAYCILKPLAERGQAEAQYRLGWMYANGEGLRVDDKSAVKYWKLAARQGHEEAQFRVAMAYLHGEGVQRNAGQAVEWLHKLALKGDDDARDMLLQLVRENEPSAVEKFQLWLRTGAAGLGREMRVKVDKANLRKGAGKKHPVIKVLKRGARVVELGRSGNWVNVGVLGDGSIAWLYSSLLESK